MPSQSPSPDQERPIVIGQELSVFMVASSPATHAAAVSERLQEGPKTCSLGGVDFSCTAMIASSKQLIVLINFPSHFASGELHGIPGRRINRKAGEVIKH
ncbi:hypothetical protein HYQ44_006780 [Verticillium longisporum]|nr:hypothetical protein HYQ44_006780 [Verticillium longisporum]